MLMKQIIDTVPRNVKIVRLHELERAPDIFIRNLAQEFNLTLKKQYKKAQPSQRMHLERLVYCIFSEVVPSKNIDLISINAKLNEFEQMLGW
jgi:hypothetical protein